MVEPPIQSNGTLYKVSSPILHILFKEKYETNKLKGKVWLVGKTLGENARKN